MQFLKYKSILTGKTLNLTANVFQRIMIFDHEHVNTDNSTFFFDPEEAELNVKRRGVLEISGSLYLQTDDETSIYTEVWLALQKDGEISATRIKLLYNGFMFHKVLETTTMEFDKLDKISLEIMSTETDDIETTDEHNFITFKRLW